MSGDCRGEVYDRITGESRFGCSCEFTRKPCGYHEGLASGVETALDSTEVSDAFRDAARLRSLAATFDSHHTIEAVAIALYESERRAPKWNRLSDIGKNLRWDRARAALATPIVSDAFRDAARLRSLAATFDSHLNRDQTFTGAQVAAMLRGGGE